MGDYFLDPGIVVKEEPMLDGVHSLNMSASVPIPVKRADDYRGSELQLEAMDSPSYQDVLPQVASPESVDVNMMWSTKQLEMDIAKNEVIHFEDDIFQVDKADLIQDTTLPNIDATDEIALFGDFNFDDLLLPEENSSGGGARFLPIIQQNNYLNNLNNNNNNTLFATSCPPASTFSYMKEEYITLNSNSHDSINQATFSPTSQASSSSSLLLPTPSPSSSSLQQKHSTLHELLQRETYPSPERSLFGKSVPGPSGLPSAMSAASSRLQQKLGHASRLSSSAPTHLGLEHLWQRREPRQHLASTGSQVEAGSTSSLSTGGILSPEAPDITDDELESDEDEFYEDMSSDDSDDDEPNSKALKKKERFFWQYNVQAKGPKGQRLNLKTQTENPHVLNQITDPVFSPDCAVRGIKHSGKARKGDGNDLTPNPRKLYNIGKELDKLGRIINDMTPVSELPFNVRPKTRKEKNKLASRACRLKKKAQHEANKIKLEGLENEHKKVLTCLNQTRHLLKIKINNVAQSKSDELTQHVDKIVKSTAKFRIAGQSTEYVNKILDKMKTHNGVQITMENCIL